MRLLHPSILSCVGLFALLASCQASATQPCPNPNGCIDEASASLSAPFDVLEKKCRDANPALSRQYAAALEHVFRGEDPHFLERLRTSAIYARVREEVESEIPSLGSEKLRQACENFLKENR